MSGPCKNHKWILSAAVAVVASLLLQGRVHAADSTTPAASHPDISVITQNMARAQAENHARAKAYSVRREYRVYGDDESKARSQVVAEINYLPPNQKSYEIDESTGGMGEKVVRRILDHEVDTARDPREVLVNAGIACESINKIAQGSPHVLDLITSRGVDLVINDAKGPREISDNYKIRRAAVEASIACLTSLDTARALAEALASTAGPPRSLQEYRSALQAIGS